ncbi:hypothetical protein [Paeniglutamicibacter sp.]
MYLAFRRGWMFTAASVITVPFRKT